MSAAESRKGTAREPAPNGSYWFSGTIRMRWADATMDGRMLRPEDFRDAAAVQFSLAGPDVTFAMGERDKPVAIWH